MISRDRKGGAGRRRLWRRGEGQEDGDPRGFDSAAGIEPEAQVMGLEDPQPVTEIQVTCGTSLFTGLGVRNAQRLPTPVIFIVVPQWPLGVTRCMARSQEHSPFFMPQAQ